MNAFVPTGLDIKSSLDIAKRIRSLGFNCVRLNWSLEHYYLDPEVHSGGVLKMIDDL